ncbi:hypothetical protein [Halomonas mongoliensis]|uniref:hypothetical protein n=1 Tax=Halomonas mongoliensis TaxID=321265 RepID=UPI00403AF29A
MNTAVDIRPLPTHSLTLPATLESRATADLLGPQRHGSASGDSTPQLLNHPPVVVAHAEGGETLLNRDTVACQLQMTSGMQTPVPPSLMVYRLESASLELSLRSLNFLYGQLQPLSYQKVDANGNNLADIAARTLNTDRALYTAIAQDLFGRKSLALRHYRMLFAVTGLGDRSIRKLKNTAGKIPASPKPSTTNTDTSFDTLSVTSRNGSTDNDRMSVETPKDEDCEQQPQGVEPSGDACPLAHKPSTVPSSSSQREEHQFQLVLNEDNA